MSRKQIIAGIAANLVLLFFQVAGFSGHGWGVIGTLVCMAYAFHSLITLLGKVPKANPGISEPPPDADYVRKLTAYIGESDIAHGNSSDATVQEVISSLLNERQVLQLHNAELSSDFKRLIDSGIHLRGWWCMRIIESKRHPGIRLSCDTFNGEEQSKQTHCRYCSQPREEQS